MFSVFLSIVILAVLIMIHELGHFLAAKRMGVWAEEFGIGLPPRLFSKKIGETIYSVNALPLGGFVRLHGEQGVTNGEKKDRGLYAQKPWRRIIILAAGIILNFILGFGIIWGLLAIGHETLVYPDMPEAQNSQVIILSTADGSPAQTSGLKANDRIQEICFQENCVPRPDSEQFTDFMKQYAGQEITISVVRDNQLQSLTATPRQNPPLGQGPLGVSIGLIARVKYGFFKAGWEALKTSGANSLYMFKAIGGLFAKLFTQGDLNGFSGPVGIVKFASSAISTSFGATLNLMAMISLNLAVFNLFPLPALDGGRIAFELWEMMTKKPVSQKIEGIIHTIGFSLLIALLIVITVVDIKRII